MPFRRMKQKKYKGIYEYYRGTDPDKAVTAYYISVRDEDNKPRKIKVDATTPEEAVVALALYKNTRTKPKTDIARHKHTLETFAKLYYDQRIAVDNERERQKFEKNIFEFIDKKRPMKSITSKDSEYLQAKLQEKGFAPHYINILVTTLSVIVNWGFKNKYLGTLLETVPKLEVDNQRLKVFSDDELELIYSGVTPKYKMFLRLMYYTAQRPKSILDLKKKNITDKGIFIKGIKKGKNQSVPISPKIKDELFKWIKDLKEDDYVCSQSAKPMNYYSIVYHTKPLLNRLFNEGKEYSDPTDRAQWASLYTIRHTALTNIYKGTGDIHLTQKLANHSDSKMTDRYVKIADEQKAKGIGVL